MTRPAPLLALVAIITALFVPSAEAKRVRGADARAALVEVRHLQQGRGVRTGFELSPALARLTAALPYLSAPDRREAQAILSRPDDEQTDPENTHKWTGAEAPSSPVCGDHFCVHWTATGGDASTKPYADQMLGILETEVYPCENGTAPTACSGGPGLGWREPEPDAGLGGNDKLDVYIQDLFATERIFGYVAVDPGQAREPTTPHHAYMVLDRDYRRFGDGTDESGLAAERITAAHEYNHVLQNAYDYLEDLWMFEATAVFMED